MKNSENVSKHPKENVSEVQKSEVKNTKIAKEGSLVCFWGSGHRFCFGRGLDVSSMFWTSVVQVEQMNKKVDFTCQKTTHCKSRTLFLKSAD